MFSELQQIESAIAGLESQRALLGDVVADAALVPLRGRLAALVAMLPTSASNAQTRKQVTILFLDIVGSTTLSQHLDPEDIHAVMDGALARCTTIVAAHVGKVLQYAGDSLLAAFGTDAAREDDPERAVHTGLALLAEGRALGEEVLRQHGHDGFNVRVGVHTGGVLLGGGVDADGSIRGIAVNIAARMEQTAPAGALRISHHTYRHVRGVFDVEPQPPMQIKGVDEPIVTYLVQRAKPRAFRIATRGIEGVETRMIGRDTELELLQDAFKRLVSDRKFSAITVVAEAGLGKSRLLYEFDNWTETRPERFYLFQGRANPQTRSQPYGLLRDILAWRLQIVDSDTLPAAKAKIEQGIAPLFQADDGPDMAQAHAHLLGHLIGLDFGGSPHLKGILDDPRQIRNRGFHAAAQMFRRVSGEDGSPIVLQLEDLHWADDGTLEFLDHVAQVNHDVPMLTLGFARPTLFERRPDWPCTEGKNQRIDLHPLDKGASRILANELLKQLPEIPFALRELVTGGADGNPFYMEELIKMLVDQGAIDTGQGSERWSVNPNKLLATQVPQTLTGVLQARLDGLQPAQKLALQQASVIGLVFWDEALAALDASATQALPALVELELVVPRNEAGLEGVREYSFKHQILHQVTYDTLLKRTRREHHARAAKWFCGLTGARANDFLGATAEHFEQAGDNAQAAEFFTRAAQHAAERFAHGAALVYVERALALADLQDHATRWRLLEVRERTLDLQGRRTEQRADIAALQQLSDTLDDDAKRGEVAWRRSHIALRTSDFHAMADAAHSVIELANRVGDAGLRVRGQHRLAGALAHLGDTVASMALTQKGLAAARSLGDRASEAGFLNVLTSIANLQGNLVANLEGSQQALLINRELGDRRHEAITLFNVGEAWLHVGEHQQARRYLAEALWLIRALGDRAGEPYPLNSLSSLALRQQDNALALAHAQAALDIAVAVQSPELELAALNCLGGAELALGHLIAAATAFERAHASSTQLDSLAQCEALAGLAQVMSAQGDAAGAMRSVEALLPHLAGGGPLEGRAAGARLICHQVLARADDPRAAELLISARTTLLAKAASIADATLRHGFLNNIPEHREIEATWAAWQRPLVGASGAQ